MMALAEGLRQCGVSVVHEAQNGREGLRLLGSTPRPEMVCCDIFMPDMDGIEFINALSIRPPVPVLVLMSGLDHHFLDMAREVALARGLPLRAALGKPLMLETLGQLLGPAAA
jgi:CheY-like chemotaxis protein